MALERRLNDSPLYASPAPVHEPHLPPPGGRRRVDVVRDDSWNIPRRERVEIELAFDGDAYWLVSHQSKGNHENTKTRKRPFRFSS
jgi:hypothetical protein